MTLEGGAVCLKTKIDLCVKGQGYGGGPVISSAAQTVISAVQNYCQNIQISVIEYFHEENQKLACLVSNINQVLNLKSNSTPTRATSEDSGYHVNGVAGQIKHEDTEKKQIKSETDEEIQHLQNITRYLKQQVEAFHILATTPQLTTVCQDLTEILDAKPLLRSYSQGTQDLGQLTKLGYGIAEAAYVSATLEVKTTEQNEYSSNGEMIPAESDGTNLMAVSPFKISDQDKNGYRSMFPMAADTSENNEDSDSDANANSDPYPQEAPHSLEESVFSNHLVIKAVFKMLDIKSLKNLRVVSKNFNYFATEILCLKHCLRIRIEDNGVRFSEDNGRVIELDLNQALQSITNSVKLFQRLPTDHLELLSTNLEAPALQNFLSEYGYLVKTLKLEFYCADPSIFVFQHLLLHQVVNVEKLIVDGIPTSWDDICKDLNLFRDNQGWIQINNLKEIKVRRSLTLDDEETVIPTNLLHNLVCAAGNLRQVTGCQLLNFLAFLPNNGTNATATTSNTSVSKLYLMKTLIFDPCPETLVLYNQFLAVRDELPTGLQIQKLKIEMRNLVCHPETWPLIAVILTNFLQPISTTVEKLVFNDSLGFLETNGVQIPVFPNVSKIKLVVLDDVELADDEKKILPLNCQISRAFPNLQHLKIKIEQVSEEEEEDEDRGFFKYFGNPLPFSSLKTLELICKNNCLLPLNWVEQFSVLAPNVKIVSFGMFCIGDFGEACRIVWTKLLNLEELKFTLYLDADMEGCMDVAFTGFSEETCKRLREEQFDLIQSQSQNPGMEKIETVVRAEDWKNQRENASILDLKSLRTLRLDVFMETGRSHPFPVFLSCVAGMYAFKMCDKLKVYMRVINPCDRDFKELPKYLETILPYVTVMQFPTDM